MAGGRDIAAMPETVAFDVRCCDLEANSIGASAQAMDGMLCVPKWPTFPCRHGSLWRRPQPVGWGGLGIDPWLRGRLAIVPLRHVGGKTQE